MVLNGWILIGYLAPYLVSLVQENNVPNRPVSLTKSFINDIQAVRFICLSSAFAVLKFLIKSNISEEEYLV